MPMTLAELVRRLNDRPPVSMPDVARLGASLVGDVSGVIRRTIRVFAPISATDILEDWFPWTRDQRLATDPTVPDDERLAAIGRLVATVPWWSNAAWGGREERAWDELRDRADAEQRPIAAVKESILTEAVLLVLGDRGRFRRIRVGSRAGSFDLTDDENSADGVRPLDLPYAADPEAVEKTHRRFAESPYLYWFRREVQKAAMAILLEESYPPNDATADDAFGKPRVSLAFPDMVAVPDDYADSDPLLRALSIESYDEAARRFGTLLEQATPRQRDLLDLLSEGATCAEAARALGIAESTARVQLHRLRAKTKAV